MAVRYKGNGKYAYETHNVWNKDKKKYETKWTYLGVASEAGEYKKARGSMVRQEKLILAYGDSFVLSEYCEKSGLAALVRRIFGGLSDSIFAIAFFKLLEQSAMQHSQAWIDGNYAKLLFPDADLRTQRISETLGRVGSERLLRNFFRSYLEKAYSKKGVVIDSTGLPNDISFPLSALGRHGGGVEKQTRLLMAVDQDTSQPLYYRYMAGNIVDVSTLKTTVRELAAMGVEVECSLIDAGYYSQSNIELLYESGISFLIRLPAGRTLFAELADRAAGSMDSVANAVVYGDRALYIQKTGIRLYEKFPAFAYVCCDITRRAGETVKCLIDSEDDGLTEAQTRKALRHKGLFVIISSKDIPVKKILPTYYLRQYAEDIFKISKSYADMLPLRVHSEQTFRGMLFLNFLSVVIYKNLQGLMPGKVNVEAAMKQMRNMSCKVFEDNYVLPTEPNKMQKCILEAVNNTVGIF